MTVVADRALFAGRYRIDSVLGAGGMGIVYAGTHAELGLPVAIKVIHPSLVGSLEARARFNVEARAMAALRSPHTLRIYDAGQLGTDQCYLVTERLEGMNLGTLLEHGGPLPVETAVDYVLQACTGLSEAHALGLVHRDIKPENLFLAQGRGQAPTIKILDFGIARWVGDELRDGRITNPRSSLGSPCYQSPEQMENALSVDDRSDIWSLGLTLFELLAGFCPFEAESIQETCWKVLQGPRPSLSAVRTDIDARLSAVIERCLMLDRSKRFGSVKQLAAALRPFARAASERTASEPPVQAAVTESARRAQRRAAVGRARRGPARALALAFVSAVVLGAGALAVLHPDPRIVGTVVQATSRSALVHAGSAVRSLVALAASRSPD